jgi:hypothetical protein
MFASLIPKRSVRSSFVDYSFKAGFSITKITSSFSVMPFGTSSAYGRYLCDVTGYISTVAYPYVGVSFHINTPLFLSSSLLPKYYSI